MTGGRRLRVVTAGESHGPAGVAIVEGVPAGLTLEPEWIDRRLARRQRGYGSGGRMRIESDSVEILAGVRGTRTIGSPLALLVHNVDHTIDSLPPVTRPRPGHADLAGMLKLGSRDARDVLERASARETAARTAGGAAAARLLHELGVRVEAWVTALGDVACTVPPDASLDDLAAARDRSPFQCPDEGATEALTEAVDVAREAGDTLGGVVEIRATGLPPGIGGYATSDQKLHARLAAALCSVQAMKGVEFGDGFAASRSRGSDVHDAIVRGPAGGLRRATNRSGGIEGGMTTGEPVVVRVAMKPLSSLRRPLPSVDVETGEAFDAARQRSDVVAVHRATVVLECVAAVVLADALLLKTGGDSMAEVRRNLDAYRAACDALVPPEPEDDSPG